jgi:hypothetical protein
MTATTQSESTALAVVQQGFDLSPRNFEEAWRMAEYLADSEMVPKDFRNKPANCLVAIQWGAELGLKTMQAIQNIAVINGRPSLWGDVMLALVRASPLCEYFIETWEGAGETLKSIARTKRRGEPSEQVREFSYSDAKTAQLLGKDTYKQYGKRMIQLRARGWLIRDVYTDIMKGLHMAEEAMDMPSPEKFMGPADVVQTAADQAAAAAQAQAPECWPADLFAARLPEWHKAIKDKKATADQIVARAKTKHPLTPEQEKQIRTPPKAETTATAAASADANGEIVMTFAQVAERLNKADNLDKLAEAASLINTVADEQQRVELTEIYERRGRELAPE